ncbi:MAG: dihydrofolate reductase [Hydrogenibacillus schlegelii]|uniref:Dihydrofolate reductase n=1 Tax=Hydrogenibacillus schlegelii TaxID=1484 RepID=A0A2T5GBN6_HYDSH|nr:dihydrofolate reductase [Hydrogenibacillus schlegelii]MBT9282266.1 dihydrofolate reductase [Hydrogenibacillus schlegelii]PTQ53600.1 MAG: Dihydrofolate reductase [Hydrogenibacillus schlegelii]
MDDERRQVVPWTIIAAVDRRGAIGRGGRLPWHLPDDLRHFRETTWGHPVIMGRRTYESLGRPLPGRENVVLSRRLRPEDVPPEVHLFSSPDAVLTAYGGRPAFVIGGAEVFALFLPVVRRLLLTAVAADVGGDVFFPPWRREAWRKVSAVFHPADGRHAYPFVIETYERTGGGR